MTDQETRELTIARYIVGGVVFFAAWWIWNTLGISVLAVQTANPTLSATGFSLGVIGTEILGPALLAIGFVVSGAGKMVLGFIANVVARFDRPGAESAASASIDMSKFANASKVSANLKQLDSRIKSLESTVATWEASE